METKNTLTILYFFLILVCLLAPCCCSIYYTPPTPDSARHIPPIRLSTSSATSPSPPPSTHLLHFHLRVNQCNTRYSCHSRTQSTLLSSPHNEHVQAPYTYKLFILYQPSFTLVLFFRIQKPTVCMILDCASGRVLKYLLRPTV